MPNGSGFLGITPASTTKGDPRAFQAVSMDLPARRRQLSRGLRSRFELRPDLSRSSSFPSSRARSAPALAGRGLHRLDRDPRSAGQRSLRRSRLLRRRPEPRPWPECGSAACGSHPTGPATTPTSLLRSAGTGGTCPRGYQVQGTAWHLDLDPYCDFGIAYANAEYGVGLFPSPDLRSWLVASEMMLPPFSADRGRISGPGKIRIQQWDASARLSDLVIDVNFDLRQEDLHGHAVRQDQQRSEPAVFLGYWVILRRQVTQYRSFGARRERPARGSLRVPARLGRRCRGRSAPRAC